MLKKNGYCITLSSTRKRPQAPGPRPKAQGPRPKLTNPYYSY